MIISNKRNRSTEFSLPSNAVSTSISLSPSSLYTHHHHLTNYNPSTNTVNNHNNSNHIGSYSFSTFQSVSSTNSQLSTPSPSFQSQSYSPTSQSISPSPPSTNSNNNRNNSKNTTTNFDEDSNIFNLTQNNCSTINKDQQLASSSCSALHNQPLSPFLPQSIKRMCIPNPCITNRDNSNIVNNNCNDVTPSVVRSLNWDPREEEAERSCYERNQSRGKKEISERNHHYQPHYHYQGQDQYEYQNEVLAQGEAESQGQEEKTLISSFSQLWSNSSSHDHHNHRNPNNYNNNLTNQYQLSSSYSFNLPPHRVIVKARRSISSGSPRQYSNSNSTNESTIQTYQSASNINSTSSSSSASHPSHSSHSSHSFSNAALLSSSRSSSFNSAATSSSPISYNHTILSTSSNQDRSPDFSLAQSISSPSAIYSPFSLNTQPSTSFQSSPALFNLSLANRLTPLPALSLTASTNSNQQINNITPPTAGTNYSSASSTTNLSLLTSQTSASPRSGNENINDNHINNLTSNNFNETSLASSKRRPRIISPSERASSVMLKLTDDDSTLKSLDINNNPSIDNSIGNLSGNRRLTRPKRHVSESFDVEHRHSQHQNISASSAGKNKRVKEERNSKMRRNSIPITDSDTQHRSYHTHQTIALHSTSTSLASDLIPFNFEDNNQNQHQRQQDEYSLYTPHYASSNSLSSFDSPSSHTRIGLAPANSPVAGNSSLIRRSHIPTSDLLASAVNAVAVCANQAEMVNTQISQQQQKPTFSHLTQSSTINSSEKNNKFPHDIDLVSAVEAFRLDEQSNYNYNNNDNNQLPYTDNSPPPNKLLHIIPRLISSSRRLSDKYNNYDDYENNAKNNNSNTSYDQSNVDRNYNFSRSISADPFQSKHNNSPSFLNRNRRHSENSKNDQFLVSDDNDDDDYEIASVTGDYDADTYADDELEEEVEEEIYRRKSLVATTFGSSTGFLQTGAFSALINKTIYKFNSLPHSSTLGSRVESSATAAQPLAPPSSPISTSMVKAIIDSESIDAEIGLDLNNQYQNNTKWDTYKNNNGHKNEMRKEVDYPSKHHIHPHSHRHSHDDYSRPNNPIVSSSSVISLPDPPSPISRLPRSSSHDDAAKWTSYNNDINHHRSNSHHHHHHHHLHHGVVSGLGVRRMKDFSPAPPFLKELSLPSRNMAIALLKDPINKGHGSKLEEINATNGEIERSKQNNNKYTKSLSSALSSSTSAAALVTVVATGGRISNLLPSSSSSSSSSSTTSSSFRLRSRQPTALSTTCIKNQIKSISPKYKQQQLQQKQQYQPQEMDS